MINIRTLIVCLLLSTLATFSCRSSRQGRVWQGKDGKIEKARILATCTPPQRTYAKEIDARLKAEIDSLRYTPQAAFEASLEQKVVKLHEYSSQGLDWDLVAFRICELANNRGMTSEQASALMDHAMQLWEGAHKSQTPQQVAISYNQQGGITANNVFVNPKVRLSDIDKNKLLSFLPDREKKVSLKALMGNSDSYDLAKQMDSFLKAAGYQTSGFIGQFIRQPEIKGVVIDSTGGFYTISVGYLNQ